MWIYFLKLSWLNDLLLRKGDSRCHPLFPPDSTPVSCPFSSQVLSTSTALALVFLRPFNKLTERLAVSSFCSYFCINSLRFTELNQHITRTKNITGINTKLNRGGGVCGQKAIGSTPLSSRALARWSSSSSAPFNNMADEQPLKPGHQLTANSNSLLCNFSKLAELNTVSTFTTPCTIVKSWKGRSKKETALQMTKCNF